MSFCDLVPDDPSCFSEAVQPTESPIITDAQYVDEYLGVTAGHVTDQGYLMVLMESYLGFGLVILQSFFVTGIFAEGGWDRSNIKDLDGIIMLVTLVINSIPFFMSLVYLFGVGDGSLSSLFIEDIISNTSFLVPIAYILSPFISGGATNTVQW